jgi:Tfp pilus assembly protein PilE
MARVLARLRRSDGFTLIEISAIVAVASLAALVVAALF